MYARRLTAVGLAMVALLWMSAWADGTITDVNRKGAGLELRTWMIVGNKYQLQCSTNLIAGAWQDLGEEISATGTSTNMTAGTEAKSCWFRVVEESVPRNGPTTPPSPPPAVPYVRPMRQP